MESSFVLSSKSRLPKRDLSALTAGESGDVVASPTTRCNLPLNLSGFDSLGPTFWDGSNDGFPVPGGFILSISPTLSSRPMSAGDAPSLLSFLEVPARWLSADKTALFLFQV